MNILNITCRKKVKIENLIVGKQYYRETHDLTWHESEDLKTGYLVLRDIHDSLPHAGGHSIVKEILGRGD